MSMTKQKQTQRCKKQAKWLAAVTGKKAEARQGRGLRGYTLLCIKQIRYKNILHGTKNIVNISQ